MAGSSLGEMQYVTLEGEEYIWCLKERFITKGYRKTILKSAFSLHHAVNIRFDLLALCFDTHRHPCASRTTDGHCDYRPRDRYRLFVRRRRELLGHPVRPATYRLSTTQTTPVTDDSPWHHYCHVSSHGMPSAAQ